MDLFKKKKNRKILNTWLLTSMVFDDWNCLYNTCKYAQNSYTGNNTSVFFTLEQCRDLCLNLHLINLSGRRDLIEPEAQKLINEIESWSLDEGYNNLKECQSTQENENAIKAIEHFRQLFNDLRN